MQQQATGEAAELRAARNWGRAAGSWLSPQAIIIHVVLPTAALSTTHARRGPLDAPWAENGPVCKNDPKILPNKPWRSRLFRYPIEHRTLTPDEDTDMVSTSVNGRRNADKIQQEAPSKGRTTMANVITEDKGRLQAIERTVGQIEKTFGKGSIMRLDGDAPPVIKGIPTGALSLDIALGGRGVPRGRVVEIFGPESSGKTTLALSIVANAQQAGGVAAFIDAEHALDPSWAKRIGVNLDQMLVSQPDTGEQALEICELLVRSNAVDVIVVDSVAALIPRAEIEGEMGDSHVGLQARLMSQALRKLTGAI